MLPLEVNLKHLIPLASLLLLSCSTARLTDLPTSTAYEIAVRGGTIYDGSGGAPYRGDVAITGDRIVAIGKFEGRAKVDIDATGKAVAPGFINMLSWANESLIADGRGPRRTFTALW